MKNQLNPKPNNQVGGDHYSRLAIEPIQFIEANGLNYCEGNAVKYISRWRNKNGLEDLKKAKWYIERLIQIEEQNEASNEVREPLTQNEVDAQQMDLYFFGWHEMSEETRAEVTAEAARSGRFIVEVLRDRAESDSDAAARLLWSKQG